jgi:hypothetical protein
MQSSGGADVEQTCRHPGQCTHIVTAVGNVAHTRRAALDSVEPAAETETGDCREAVAGQSSLVDDSRGRLRVGTGEDAKDGGEVRLENVQREHDSEEQGSDGVRVNVDRLVVNVCMSVTVSWG